ncbi:MAG: hypothetical protein AABW86_00235 [Candidatus Micrarchaeota archaeon]
MVRSIILEKFASMLKDLKNPDIVLRVAIRATNGKHRNIASIMLAFVFLMRTGF